MTDLRISQLAERTGIPATTLRFYETAGLLPAGRTPNGYRVYDEEAVDRLNFIGAAKRLGLPLEEIAELLEVWANGSCAQVREDLRPRLAARVADAERRASELAAFTTTLHRAVEHLDALADGEGRCGTRCGFLGTKPISAKPISARRPVTLHRTREEAEVERWRTAPVACSLDGRAMGERAAQWRSLLAGAEYERIPDGVRLGLSPDRAAQVAGLAAAEQRCCPFFDFRLHLADGRLRFEIRAPAGAVEMLADLFMPGTRDGLVDDPATSPRS